MARNKIEVEVVGDASSLKRALDDAENSTGRLGGGLAKVGKAAAAAGVAVGAGFVIAAKKSIDAASNLGESVNAVNVTFGKAAPQVQKFTQSAAKLGLSTRAANEAMVPLGAGLQNLGFSAGEAATASIDLTKRAADMASVFNTDLDEALGAIQAGLRGEADPLERFGVGLSAAAVNAKAMSMGLAESEKALTAQDKAQARVALLMEQTNKVAGDFANTSGGLANAQRILKAEVENAGAAIGQALLPVAAKAASAVADFIPKALDAARALVDKLTPAISGFAGIVQQHMPTIRALFAAAADFIRTNVVPIILRLKDVFQESLAAIATVVQDNLPTIRKIFSDFGQTIRNIAEVVIPILEFALKEVLPAAIKIALPVVRELAELSRRLSERFGNMAEKAGLLKEKMEPLEDPIRKAAKAFDFLARAVDKADLKIGDLLEHLPMVGPVVKAFGKFSEGDTSWGVGERSFGTSASGSISSGLWDEIAGAKHFGLEVSSGHRPGAITSSGRPSKHGVFPSKAIDVAGSAAGMRAFALWAAGRPGIEDVFYDPLGGRFRIGGHRTHVHVEEFGLGGVVSHDGGGMGAAVPIIAHAGEGVFTPGQMAALAPAYALSTSLRDVITEWEGTQLLREIRDNTAKLVEQGDRGIDLDTSEVEATREVRDSVIAGIQATAGLGATGIPIGSAAGAPLPLSHKTSPFGGSVIADPDTLYIGTTPIIVKVGEAELARVVTEQQFDLAKSGHTMPWQGRTGFE